MYLNDKEKRQVKEQLTALFEINNLSRLDKWGQIPITMENCEKYGISSIIVDPEIPTEVHAAIFCSWFRHPKNYNKMLVVLEVFLLGGEKKFLIEKIVNDFVQKNDFRCEFKEVGYSTIPVTFFFEKRCPSTWWNRLFLSQLPGNFCVCLEDKWETLT